MQAKHKLLKIFLFIFILHNLAFSQELPPIVKYDQPVIMLEIKTG